METVIRAAGIYFFLLIVLRAAGRRTLSEMTTFDLVLLLIISEATQQGMISDDYSMTNAFLVILTLVGIDIFLSWIKSKWNWIDDIFSSIPMVIVAEGKPLKDRLVKARIDEGDILEAARILQGLERMEQIKYAILEKNGSISIIPKRHPDAQV